MKQIIVLLLSTAMGVIMMSCKESGTNPPEEKPPGYQEDIPWPSLADSPWPMNHHDPQSTGRSKYIGPNSAQILLEKEFQFGISSGPIIGYNSDLFFGTDYHSANKFYRTNNLGDVVWEFTTIKGKNDFGCLLSHDSILYFISGYQDSGKVYAVGSSGVARWTFKPESRAVSVVPTIDKVGNLYFNTYNGSLISLNKNGELRWSIKPAASAKSIYTAFKPDGNIIYLSGSSGVFAVSINGELIWTHPCEMSSWVSVDNGGNVYSVIRDSASIYLASIASNGTLNWKYTFSKNQYDIGNNGMTITYDNRIVIHAIDTALNIFSIYSFDLNGDLNWKYGLPTGEEISQPLISDKNGNVYFGSTRGRTYYSLDKNGNVRWTLNLAGREVDYTSAIDSDGCLIIGTNTSTYPQGKTLIKIKGN